MNKNGKTSNFFSVLLTFLKGHGNEGDFWGFCRNLFLIDPVHYLSSCYDLGIEFAEIFVIEKRLPNSASRVVADSPSRRVGI
jgi:hypothetical protein